MVRITDVFVSLLCIFIVNPGLFSISTPWSLAPSTRRSMLGVSAFVVDSRQYGDIHGARRMSTLLPALSSSSFGSISASGASTSVTSWRTCTLRSERSEAHSCGYNLKNLRTIGFRLFAHHPQKKSIRRIMDKRPIKHRPSDINRNNVNLNKCITKFDTDIPDYTVVADEGKCCREFRLPGQN
jgi:hypothetical protein